MLRKSRKFSSTNSQRGLVALGSPESLRPRQLCLPLVEGPKTFGFELQRAGDVQAVEGANPELRTMAAAQLCAELEGVLGYGGGDPKSRSPIGL